MSPGSRDRGTGLENAEEWTRLLTLLSNCLKHPDAELEAAISDGTLEDELGALTGRLGVERSSSVPEAPDSDLTADYEALFGALREPFAPPAASPYKEWYGDREGGLMDGPPAARMEDRLERLEVSIPDPYPPDHVAVQLEYASLLAETGSIDELAAFVDAELDWVDALGTTVTQAAAEAPFHRYCVSVLVTTVERLRDEFGIDGPSENEIEQMIDRTTARRI
jgi:TorA maturation chaperone TorD